MEKVTTIHSFRRGVGKSTLAANLAVLMALRGRRVALVDTDFQAASAHLFFNIPESECNLNSVLWGNADILEAAYDVTPAQAGPGKLYVIPASMQVADIVKSLRMSLTLEYFTERLHRLVTSLNLDSVLLDTPSGLQENTLVSLAFSNALVMVLHPDKQDFQGTAVTVEVARKLHIANIHIAMNDAPETLEERDAQIQLQESYGCNSCLVLKHAEELLALGSAKPFVLHYPNHSFTHALQTLAEKF